MRTILITTLLFLSPFAFAEEKKKLTEQIGEYTDELVTSFRLNSIRITRVEYEDGSSWQRPAEETK